MLPEKICPKCNYVHSFLMCPCRWVELTPPKLKSMYGLATLDDLTLPDQKSLLLDILSFIKPGNTSGLILTGPTGAGKTHTAISLCKQSKNNKGTSFNLIGKLPGFPSSYEEVYNDALTYDWLIIDEIESHHFELVRERTERGKFTIGTTNILQVDPRFYGWRMAVFEVPPIPDDIRSEQRSIKREEYKKWFDYKNPPLLSKNEFEKKFKNGEVTLHQTDLMEPWERDTFLRELKAKKRMSH